MLIQPAKDFFNGICPGCGTPSTDGDNQFNRILDGSVIKCVACGNEGKMVKEKHYTAMKATNENCIKCGLSSLQSMQTHVGLLSKPIITCKGCGYKWQSTQNNIVRSEDEQD